MTQEFIITSVDFDNARISIKTPGDSTGTICRIRDYTFLEDFQRGFIKFSRFDHIFCDFERDETAPTYVSAGEIDNVQRIENAGDISYSAPIKLEDLIGGDDE